MKSPLKRRLLFSNGNESPLRNLMERNRQLHGWLQKSKYKAEDDANKNRIEAKNGLENYCYSLKSSVGSPELEGKIPADDNNELFFKEEAVNQPLVATYIVPNLRHCVQEVPDNALKCVETSNYELEFRTKSNEIRYLLVNVTTRQDRYVNIVSVVGVAQDEIEGKNMIRLLL